MAQKQKIPVYLQPENMKRLEEHYKDDGSTTRTEFIEKAINFYIGYLQAVRDAAYLPQVISSAMEGRLGMLEDRLSALSFKQSVELEMMVRLLAAYFSISKETLRRLRGESVSSVRATNGRLAFEQIAQGTSPVEEDEEWQD